MKKGQILLLAVVILQSCFLESKKITITKDYIINEYWDDYNNAIYVEKLKVKKDSVLDIFDPSFKRKGANNWNVVHKLEVDDSFYFGYSGLNANVEKKKMKGKISFTKDNGFDWYTNKGNVSVIGELKKNTWYKFKGLRSRAYYLFVYVDSIGNTHKFSQDLSNF